MVVLVGGQPTTDDDSDKSIVDPLIYNTVTKLVADNNMLKEKIAQLEAQVSTKSKSVCLVFRAICTGRAKNVSPLRFYYFSRTIESYDIKCYSLITHSIIHRSGKSRYITRKLRCF